MGLGLMLSYIFSLDVSRSAPESQGVKSIELWMVYCLCMVFAALSEYGIVLYVKFRKPTTTQKVSHKTGIQKVWGNDSRVGENIVNVNTMGSSHEASKAIFKRHDAKECDATQDANGKSLDTTVLLCKKIDTISLFLFPTAFFSFLAIYSVLYLNVL